MSTPLGPIRARVVITGDSSVGKTSLLSSLLGGAFNPYTEPTVGANWQSYTPAAQQDSVQLQIWDTAGQERYRSLGPLYYRGAVGCVIVYDVTNRCSFESIPTWVTAFQNAAGTEAIILIVGNKCDLEQVRDVTKDEASDWARRNGFPYFEASAKTGENVTLVFDDLAEKVAAGPRRLGSVQEQMTVREDDSSGCC
jgi:small GTP-binding protein